MIPAPTSLSGLKRLLLWLLCGIAISLALGLGDYWVAGTSLGHPVFSLPIWKLRDGGTTGYLGFGYSLTNYRKMGGERGPELWFWFSPFTVYRTSQRSGIHWLIFASGPREPRYKGHSFSHWVNEYFDAFHPTPDTARLEAAKAAIRAMGTNTIPTLISWLSEDHPSIGIHSTVLEVFRILGETGKPAAPDLVRLTRSKDKWVRYYALDCLLAIDAEKETLVPALVTLVKDPDKNIGFKAAQELLGLDPNAAERAGVSTLFPEMK